MEILFYNIEFRETVEEWGYLWAHRLLEDAFIRPNFDIESILKSILSSSLKTGDLSIPEEGNALKPKGNDSDLKSKKMNEFQNRIYLQKKKKLEGKTSHALEKAMFITRKVLWHVQFIGIGMATMEVVFEGEKHDEMMKLMDHKIGNTK